MAKTKKFINARSKLKCRAEMQADENDPRHGTTNGYGLGCRCERCRDAMRMYSKNYSITHREQIAQRQHRYYRQHKDDIKFRNFDRYAKAKARLESNPDDPQHGTRTGYNYGCRCERCSEASRTYNKKRWEERKKNG